MDHGTSTWLSSAMIHLACPKSLLLNPHKIKSLYNEHPKTGPSGFQMVIFRTLLGFGFLNGSKTRPKIKFSTSLDRFTYNKPELVLQPFKIWTTVHFTNGDDKKAAKSSY
jgi:hypothetical protein